MLQPAIYGYIESLKEPKGLFRTLGEPVCERDLHGEPKFTAGGNAAVFRITYGGKDYALKCFTKPVEHAAAIREFLSGTCDALLCRSVYLPGEIFVFDTGDSGRWHDVVLTEWAEGRTLDFEMRKAMHDGNRERLARLAEIFDRSAVHILGAEWAHGDIKPENIILSPGDRLKLIDYDSMYVPSLEGRVSRQTGTPLWCHPRRNELYFNRHIDDYPLAMLSATLHCLAECDFVFMPYAGGEVFLFDPDRITDNTSECYLPVRDAVAKSGNAPLHRLLDMLRSPTPNIPGLDEIIVSLGRGYDGPGPLSLFYESGAWGYKDGNGNTAIPPLFDSALEFSEGLAAVRLENYNHFIDMSGSCVINCSAYDSVKSFSEGLAAVKQNDLWGYIGRDGRVVVQPQYARASSVRNGRSEVVSGGIKCEIEPPKTK
jgi:Serine/threonine protein kinase